MQCGQRSWWEGLSEDTAGRQEPLRGGPRSGFWMEAGTEAMRRLVQGLWCFLWG